MRRSSVTAHSPPRPPLLPYRLRAAFLIFLEVTKKFSEATALVYGEALAATGSPVAADAGAGAAAMPTA
jgi:hypothetical protein